MGGHNNDQTREDMKWFEKNEDAFLDEEEFFKPRALYVTGGEKSLEVLKKNVRNMTMFISTNVLRRKISLKSLILL
jgi:protein associated with RNAse G/E